MTETEHPTWTTRKILAGWFGFVTMMVAFNAYHAVIDYMKGGGTAIWHPIFWEASSIYVSGILMVLVYRFTAAYPFTSGKRWQRLLQHFAASLVFSTLHISGMMTIRKGVYAALDHSYNFPTLSGWAYEFSKDITTYIFTVIFCHALLAYERLRREQWKNLQLEAKLTGLQLSLLRERLRPHFLFNTLNLISSTMYEDVEKADKLLADLCTLLRRSLEAGNPTTASLAEEMRFLEIYLAIVHERFSGRLQTEVCIDPTCHRARVPWMMLQPLVENAVEHGFARQEGRGRIRVTADAEDDRLKIRVADDGGGLTCSPEEAKQAGLGISNTIATLELLFPDDFRFELLPNTPKGLMVFIDLPLQNTEDHPVEEATLAHPDRG